MSDVVKASQVRVEMTNYQKGYSYEDFVEAVYNAILEAEGKSENYKAIKLQRRKQITSKSGTKAEIDIYWEFQQAAITHSVAIECKNENRNVGIGAVRDFARKISDISGLKGLIVSNKGFSKYAIQEAEADNIDLLIIRPQEDKDWEGYLKEIHLNMNFKSPSRVFAMRPYINKRWAQQNGYPEGSEIKFNAMNNELFIEDKSIDFRESIHSLQGKHFFKPNDFGSQTWSKDFENGWLSFEPQSDSESLNINAERYKLDRIEIDYIQSSPIKTEEVIDFTQNAIAVMEYISGKSEKFLVLKNGRRSPFNSIGEDAIDN